MCSLGCFLLSGMADLTLECWEKDDGGGVDGDADVDDGDGDNGYAPVHE